MPSATLVWWSGDQAAEVIAGTRVRAQKIDHRIDGFGSQVVATAPAQIRPVVDADGEDAQLVAVTLCARELDAHQVTDLRQREERRERGECGRKSKPDLFFPSCASVRSGTARIVPFGLSSRLGTHSFMCLAPPDLHRRKVGLVMSS